MKQALAALLALVTAAGCVSKPEKEKVQTGTAFKSANALTDAEKGKVVARIGDHEITLEQFERELNQQSPFARARYNSLERKREFLDGLVRFELLAIEAQKKGYDKDPDVVLAMKQAMVKRLAGDDLTRLVKMEDISDADVAAYYQQHITEYDKPAEVRASHILLKDEAKARKLQADLKAAIAKDPFKARDLFSDAARQQSEDAATRETGGDLRFFGKPGESRAEDRGPTDPPLPPPAVADAAWAIDKVGDLAPDVIKASDGWHLVQKTGFKRPYKRELDEVKTSIRNQLFRERKAQAMEDYVKKLREDAKVQIDDAVLEQAKAAPGGPEPGMLPNFGPGGPPLPIDKPQVALPGSGAPTPAPPSHGAPQ